MKTVSIKKVYEEKYPLIECQDEECQFKFAILGLLDILDDEEKMQWEAYPQGYPDSEWFCPMCGKKAVCSE